jgi:hypothetical protein
MRQVSFNHGQGIMIWSDGGCENEMHGNGIEVRANGIERHIGKQMEEYSQPVRDCLVGGECPFRVSDPAKQPSTDFANSQRTISLLAVLYNVMSREGQSNRAILYQE